MAAGWFDYDGDGFLDLFVVNYVAWNPDTEQVCKDPKSGEAAYCHPQFYTGPSQHAVSQQRRWHVHRRLGAVRHSARTLAKA